MKWALELRKQLALTVSMAERSVSFKYSLHAFSFLVQIWGLPFEHMSLEVGKELGNSLGNFIEYDRRTGHSDQAKFMRIRVDLQLDKPLRRGGKVASVDGERFWVSFKYEKLPVFCFFCGRLGHDERHCQECKDS